LKNHLALYDPDHQNDHEMVIAAPRRADDRDALPRRYA